MDNLNFKNLQLSYQAVYDETLCESMDELGLFGEYDYIDEAMAEGPRKQKMIAKQFDPHVSAKDRATAFNVGVRDDRPRDKKSTGGKGARFSDYGDRGAGNKARRRAGLAPLRGNTRNEEVELYELILSHLLDEGYTDNLESAIAIVENMSDEWIQDIVENKL
jgi:hypothetical protein